MLNLDALLCDFDQEIYHIIMQICEIDKKLQGYMNCIYCQFI